MANVNRGIVFRQIERLYREGTLAGLGDGSLLERYLTRGDEAAFEALVNLHGPMVLGLCRRMLHDPRDVEDAFQATFLILVRKASSIRDRTLLSNWLYGVAYRVAIRTRANAIRRRGRETGVGNLDVAAAPEASEHQGIGPVLDQELNRLPEKYRAPLVLCYLRSRTHDQAAEELCCPVGTVRSRLARGRELLKDRLTRRGYAPTAAILGPGTSLPGQVLTVSVPPSLLASTVRTALGFGSLKVFPPGAASATALALSHGVLTTMKLAQMKWIGLAVLATGLSAGGVIAVSQASGQAPGGTTNVASTSEVGVDLREEAKPQSTDKRASSTPASELETQRKTELEMDEMQRRSELEMEKKIDKLLKDIGFFGSDGSAGSPASDGSVAGKVLARKLGPLLGVPGVSTPTPATAAPTANDPFLRATKVSRTHPESRSTQSITNAAIRELENQLKREVKFYEMHEHHPQLDIPDEPRDAVLATRAILEGVLDDLAEVIARLKLEMRRKLAELEKANAMSQVATTMVARNTRLNERKPGMVSSEDVAKANAELKVADAAIEVKKVEIEEGSLQLRQLERGSDRISKLIELANSAKAQVKVP